MTRLDPDAAWRCGYCGQRVVVPALARAHERTEHPDSPEAKEQAVTDRVMTQYKDPILDVEVTVVTCPEHDSQLLKRLKAAKLGSGSCTTGSLARCTFCERS